MSEGNMTSTECSRGQDNIARGVGEKGNVDLMPTMYGGHCFYVRKCVTGDQKGEDFWDRSIDGIFIPQTAADRSIVVEVLAKGTRVGKPCSDEHMELHKRERCVADDVNVGDKLVCPNMHPTGIKRSPICGYEYFIEETVPLYALSGSEDNDE